MKKLFILIVLFSIGCTSAPDFKDTKKRIEIVQEDSKTYRKKVQESSCSISEKRDFESGLDKLDKNIQAIKKETEKNSIISNEIEEKLFKEEKENFWLWSILIGQILILIIYFLYRLIFFYFPM